MKRLVVFLALLSLFNGSAFAQTTEFYPGAQYDSAVPTPHSILGYEIGEYFTDHHQMEEYIHALAKAVPERVKFIHIGRSIERRNMYVVIISSPENMQRLEDIRKTVVSLRDPRSTSPAAAQKITAETPVIAFMNYANDGNESAAFEACLQVAYHFAAGQDAETTSILDNAVIVLNPAHNPESHQRYIAWMKASIVGPNGTADPFAAEHNRDWRMSTNNNHYQIDLNRDGFALSQVESRIVAEQLHHWSPQVFVDHHGETNEYFFAPYAVPVNLNMPPATKKWANLIGRNNGAAFDRFGWSYFAREVYDLHYPGYWDSYPALNGAIGMTYETDGGGRKGLQFERPDKTILTFRDGIHHHVVASITTIKSAADNRQEMLQDYYAFFNSGMEEAKNEPIKQVALVPGADAGRLADLVELLLRHKIEVYAAEENFSINRAHHYVSKKVNNKSFPAGTFLVPYSQPQKRLAKALLEADANMEEVFLKEARKNYEYNESLGKNAPKERLGFYDVTAWSLPLAYGVEAYGLEKAFAGRMRKLQERPTVQSGVQLTNGPATYAYAFDYNTNAGAKLLAQLLKEDFKVAISRKTFTVDGTDFARGTVIARVARNAASLHGRITELAKSCEVPVIPLNSAWTDKGVMLGSNNLINLKKPKIAVITEEPARQTSYGAIWYLLEKQYEYDFTAIRLDYFQRVDLRKYDVLVFPPGSASGYQRGLGESGIKKIKEWVQSGGVFVGVGGGAVFATKEKVGLTSAKLLGATPEKTKKEEDDKEKKQGENKKPNEKEEKPDFTPGAILKLKLDTYHFMSLGYDEVVPVLVRSSNIFTPSKDGVNVGVFAEQDVRISGFIWEKTEKMFPGNVYLIHEPTGNGDVILFAEEPIFRLYWRGLERLFLSSLLLAPSF
ncbi:MAG: M14 family zinc carboxypeptidase [Calditrichaeota bacterium]|nr:M14 family zinc carboxypeptidase [Calditrichota bacterium]